MPRRGASGGGARMRMWRAACQCLLESQAAETGLGTKDDTGTRFAAEPSSEERERE